MRSKSYSRHHITGAADGSCEWRSPEPEPDENVSITRYDSSPDAVAGAPLSLVGGPSRNVTCCEGGTVGVAKMGSVLVSI